jgi:hypothetical protein
MPKTGDYMNIALYIGLLALGGAAAVGLTIYLAVGRRRKSF